MENLILITDANHLNKIFENAADKLVVIMFYTKNNPNCRRARASFEKASQNHIISYFCIVDVDKFEGDSRYVKNITNLPKFDCYYQGNQVGSFAVADDKEIEEAIRSGERYVMMQNNMKNNQNNMSGMMSMNQTSQLNADQIKQQIINTTMMQNPAFANQLMQNPAMLNQMVQRQMQQQMMMPNVQQMPNMNLPQMTAPIIQNTPVPQVNMPAIANPAINPIPSTITCPASNVLPTLEQMQYYFKIFQMMQQMGVLNMNAIPTIPTNDTAKPSSDADNTIVLPNGDKIIPLPNGKYGLIKKPT